MAIAHGLSRRSFLAGIVSAAAATTARVAAAADDPPLIHKRVEKLYKVVGCTQPNDLQFTADGLWVLDQVDPNKVFKVRPDDGSILLTLQTESLHGSGITYGNGALWIGSTKGKDAADPPRTLKVDPKTGATLKSWVTPGSGLYGNVNDALRRARSEVGGRQVLDGRAGVGEALLDGAGNRRGRSLGSRTRCPHARPRLGTRGLVVHRVEPPRDLQARPGRRQGRGEDPVGSRGPGATRPRHQSGRALVLRRGERLDLPAGVARPLA